MLVNISLKLNFNVIVFKEFTTLAMVAEDDNDEVIKGWTKIHSYFLIASCGNRHYLGFVD